MGEITRSMERISSTQNSNKWKMMILHHSKVTSCLHSLPLCSVADNVFVDAANDMVVDKKADSDAMFCRKQTNNKPRVNYINAKKTVTGNCSNHL